MAYTQAKIDDLEDAIAQGITTVRSGDDSMTYRSLEEMRKILRIMKGELAGSSTRKMYPRYQQATFADD